MSISACRVHGKRPVHWIADHDWLGPDVWFAHLVHLDAEEMQLLASTPAPAWRIARSRTAGSAPASRRPTLMARLGGAVSLGVDGAASERIRRHDQRDAQRLAYPSRRSRAPPRSPRKMSCTGRPRAAPACSGCPRIGTLAPGQAGRHRRSSISRARVFGMHDPADRAGHLRRLGRPSQLLMVGGRVVVENGAIPGLDLAKTAARCRPRGDAVRSPDRGETLMLNTQTTRAAPLLVRDHAARRSQGRAEAVHPARRDRSCCSSTRTASRPRWKTAAVIARRSSPRAGAATATSSAAITAGNTTATASW